MRAARSPDRTQTTAGATSHRRPDRTYSVVVRTRPQTERATDSAIGAQCHRTESRLTAVSDVAGTRLRHLSRESIDRRTMTVTGAEATADSRWRLRAVPGAW